ncbi:Hypothetical_protein [Hexamita inflata]|uniref:Hypothetical_protein n=1 Tax=Hexamita inflata TaxID=28002 RepID=A0AA86UHH2_9EUKA|nr:Hypothetical protein HINF_LOCUS43604 [Hexamita inflata]
MWDQGKKAKLKVTQDGLGVTFKLKTQNMCEFNNYYFGRKQIWQKMLQITQNIVKLGNQLEIRFKIAPYLHSLQIYKVITYFTQQQSDPFFKSNVGYIQDCTVQKVIRNYLSSSFYLCSSMQSRTQQLLVQYGDENTAT